MANILVEDNLRKILRAGLIANPASRVQYIQELKKYPQTVERNYVESALKDFNTTLDDQEQVESGEHYNNWIGNNIKMESNKKGSDKKILKESLPSSFNEFLTDIAKNHDVDSFIEISDSNGKYKDLTLKVDIEELLDYLKKGDYFLDNESIDNGFSNNKIMNVLKSFTSQLCKDDQEAFKKSLNHAIDYEKNKHTKKYVSLKSFIDAYNKKLTHEERMKFLALLLKNSKDIWNKYDNNKQ